MPKKQGFKPRLRLPLGTHIPSHKGKIYEIVNGGAVGYSGYGHMLGCGGSGEVYLVKDKELNRPVAIKIFIPNYQLRLFPDMTSASVQDIEGEYRQEVQSLSAMKHQNIVTLFDIDTFKLEELGDKQKKNMKFEVAILPTHQFHYIVTEFIPGMTLSEYLSHTLPDMTLFLRILSQVCNALIYLHENKNYLHCDLKTNNIIVHPDSLNVTIIDFALTRNLNLSEVKGTDKVTLIGDFTIFPKDLSPNNVLQQMMETRAPLLTRAEFKKYAFPRLDIFHFGIVLEKCLSLMKESVSNEDYFYLKKVMERCKDFKKTDWWYNAVRDVAYDIEKLIPDYESPHRIRTLGESIRGEHIIQLSHPMHAVNFGDPMGAIIDSPQFQRLRTIQQLDLCHLIFPGATHTRFLHSLHCYQLMSEFLVKLASDRMMRMFLSDRFVNLALVASLLHDVFHFPFLHVFEEIGYESEVQGDTLSSVDLQLIADQHGVSLNDLLERMDINPEALWGVIKGWSKTIADKEKRCIHSFLDGGVDLDKISYLFYDSYYTGVPDGVGLDIHKLIRSSQITRREPYVLGWRASGLSPLEQVIMARYQLFKKVYWNADNRSAIARVKYVMMRLIENSKLTKEEYVKRTMFTGQSGALIMLNELYKKEINPYSPIEDLIAPKRNYMLLISSGRKGTSGRKRTPEIPEDDILFSSPGDKILRVSDRLSRWLMEECGGDVLPGEVIIDVPGRKVDEMGEAWVDDDSGTPKLIQELSDPIRHMKANWVKHVKRIRVFVSERIANDLGKDRVHDCIADAMGW